MKSPPSACRPERFAFEDWRVRPSPREGYVKSPLTRHTVVYIVRVWVEYVRETPPVWRGEVALVGSEEVHHFRNLEELSELIRRSIPLKTENLSED